MTADHTTSPTPPGPPAHAAPPTPTGAAPGATAPGTSSGPVGKARLFFVDNLRVFLTVLVVLHHLAITYAVVSPWYYVEYTGNGLHTVLGLAFVLLNQAYFMGFFFLISGYFTPASVDRKGPGAFVRGRLVRLGVPLLAFTFAIGPLTGQLGRFATLPPEWKPDTRTGLLAVLGRIDPGPLWFVEVLLVLALGYAAWRLVRRTPVAAVPQQPPRYWQVGLFALGLAVVTFLVRLVVPIGVGVPVLGLPTPAYLPQYVSFFVVGMIAYRRGWFLAITDRMGRFGWLVAAVASVVALPVALLGSGQMTGGANIHAFAYALWDSTFAVGVCLGLLTLFRKRIGGQGKVRRFASANAFGVYVLHAPVITLLAVAVRGVDVNPILKFAVLAPFAVAATFGVAYLVRMIPGVKKVL